MANPFDKIQKASAPKRDAATLSKESQVVSYKPPPVLQTPPTNPSDGDHWHRDDIVSTSTGQPAPEIHVQLQGDTFHTDLSPADGPTPAQAAVPVGAVSQYAGISDPPTGKWFICDGRVLDQATYPDLFNVIGTTYNTGGEAAGQFSIPDAQGRVPVGAGSGAGLSARSAGAKGGEENHTMITSEMPSHNHGGSTNSDSHSHGPGFGESHFITHIDQNAANPGTGSSTTISWGWANTTDTDTHSHTLSSNGSGTAHNNMPPFLVLSYILKVLP